MKTTAAFLAAIILSAVGFAQSDLVRVPTVKLNAVTAGNARRSGATEAPNPEAARQTVAHGSSVNVSVENVGSAPVNVTLRWFAVGRYETSKNFFRNGDGEKQLKVAPKSSGELTVDCNIQSHVTKSKKGSYESGGKLVGWVVAMYDDAGKLVDVAASDPALARFGTEPPNRQRGAGPSE